MKRNYYKNAISYSCDVLGNITQNQCDVLFQVVNVYKTTMIPHLEKSMRRYLRFYKMAVMPYMDVRNRLNVQQWQDKLESLRSESYYNDYSKIMNQILTSVGDLVSDDEYKAAHNGKPPKTPDDLKIRAIWMKEFELLYSAGILKYARSIVDAEVFYNKNCHKTRPETENSCEVAKKMITEIMSIMQKVNGLISSANAILRTIETDKEKAGIPVFGRKRIIGEIEQLVGILDSSIKPTVVQYHPYTQIKASVVRFLSGMNTEKQTIRDDDIEDMYADLKGIYDSWKRDIVKAKVEAERKKMLEEIAKAERAEIQKRMKQAAANAAAAARAKQGVA